MTLKFMKVVYQIYKVVNNMDKFFLFYKRQPLDLALKTAWNAFILRFGRKLNVIIS